jgi:hypothetical protein
MNTLMSPQHIKGFVLAGNALFSIKSLRTNCHYTFKVVRAMITIGRHHHGDPGQPCNEPECKGSRPVVPPTWKVNVLSGRDNTRKENYRYIGSIRDGHFSYLASQTTSSTKGFAWVWKNLDRVGERFEFHHAGRCGRCGRLLTVPESIESGIGPECQDKMAFEALGGAEGLLRQLL